MRSRVQKRDGDDYMIRLWTIAVEKNPDPERILPVRHGVAKLQVDTPNAAPRIKEAADIAKG